MSAGLGQKLNTLTYGAFQVFLGDKAIIGFFSKKYQDFLLHLSFLQLCGVQLCGVVIGQIRLIYLHNYFVTSQNYYGRFRYDSLSRLQKMANVVFNQFGLKPDLYPENPLALKKLVLFSRSAFTEGQPNYYE